MKKIGKLTIDPDKLIKNNELSKLRGGGNGVLKCETSSGYCLIEVTNCGQGGIYDDVLIDICEEHCDGFSGAAICVG
jgi:hypothetical protein